MIHYKFKYSCFTSLRGKFWNPYNYCSKCIYKLIMQPAYMIENLNFTLQCLTYAYNSTDLKFSEVKPGILPQQRWSFFENNGFHLLALVTKGFLQQWFWGLPCCRLAAYIQWVDPVRKLSMNDFAAFIISNPFCSVSEISPNPAKSGNCFHSSCCFKLIDSPDNMLLLLI